MALYEYECEHCGNRFERIHRFSDPPPDACPKCGQGPVRKLVSSPAFQFKGSGWYVTDYAKKTGSADEGKTAGKGSAKDGASKDASSSDSSKDSSSKSESSADSSSGGSDSKSSSADSKSSGGDAKATSKDTPGKSS